MQVGQHATIERLIAWWLDIKGVGESLRDRYEVPKELPPNLLKLVRKLDAIEENQLFREQMVEARTVGGIKAFPDWFVRT